MLSAGLPSATVITYDHDPMGKRIAKRVNGTVTEKYLWKDAITLLAVYDGSDNLVMRFNYADGRLPVSMIKGGITYYLLYDQIGTLKAVAVSTGNIIKQIDYDSFGSIIADTNPALAVPFGFAGGIHDRDTNLVRFGYRDYDPTIGRWTAKDPIDFAGGDVNLYDYVLNDPVNWIDPLGWISAKPGANTEKISGYIEGKYRDIDQAFKDSNLPAPVITSGNDSKHMQGSKHYTDEAIDLRGNNITDKQMNAVADKLKKILGPGYYVKPEFFPKNPIEDHIHIEYDPCP